MGCHHARSKLRADRPSCVGAAQAGDRRFVSLMRLAVTQGLKRYRPATVGTIAYRRASSCDPLGCVRRLGAWTIAE
jgi:hypothetical protein